MLEWEQEEFEIFLNKQDNLKQPSYSSIKLMQSVRKELLGLEEETTKEIIL